MWLSEFVYSVNLLFVAMFVYVYLFTFVEQVISSSSFFLSNSNRLHSCFLLPFSLTSFMEKESHLFTYVSCSNKFVGYDPVSFFLYTVRVFQLF